MQEQRQDRAGGPEDEKKAGNFKTLEMHEQRCLHAILDLSERIGTEGEFSPELCQPAVLAPVIELLVERNEMLEAKITGPGPHPMHPDPSRQLLPALRVLNTMFDQGAYILGYSDARTSAVWLKSIETTCSWVYDVVRPAIANYIAELGRRAELN